MKMTLIVLALTLLPVTAWSQDSFREKLGRSHRGPAGQTGAGYEAPGAGTRPKRLPPEDAEPRGLPERQVWLVTFLRL